ncbi:Pentatricopeptide repeat [Macleaya cordata]|uniref:Pentatricopeptide repeat n=1 Tax=Macleaya cordata TaxID=56857 RepID=A0A200PQW8_MACCD|nr:Pentatricopeptide repeat [Macleaya cordata]
MSEKGICKFTASNHAVQLELIGRVRGLDSAESYFNNLSDQDKTEKTYGALLSCYARACLTEKSLSHMQKMKEMGLPMSSVNYNNIMSLYININEYEKVPDVLAEMKENGISPDNLSYSICINSYAARSDINGMEKVLQEMEGQPQIFMDWNTCAMVANFYIKAGLNEKALAYLKKSEEKLGKNNGHGYNHLITSYASLGNKTEVLRLWELKKVVCKRYINIDYTIMLGSLVKLGELEEAEKLFEEWESSTSSYDFRVPNTLLIGYCQNGLVDKAQEMLEDKIKKGKSPIPNSWGIVAAGYVNKSEMEKALECMKMAFELRAGSEGWRPNPKVITSLLGWLSDKGQVEEVEDFVGSLKTVIPMDREMYHALIKANVREGKEVDELLESMKADKIDEDEETEKILSLKEVKAE